MVSAAIPGRLSFGAVHTPLTDLLGIEQPLVLAPMGIWANVSLAAAVSNGGGLGTFGAVGRLMGLNAQVVRDNLAALSDLTDRPIGAGFITQLIPESPENLGDGFGASQYPRCADRLPPPIPPGWVRLRSQPGITTRGRGAPSARCCPSRPTTSPWRSPGGLVDW